MARRPATADRVEAAVRAGFAAIVGELVRSPALDRATFEQKLEEALLVALASHRLRSMGLRVPHWPGPEPEMRLYERLYERLGDGAHSAYNALLRRLIRFEHALEADRARALR